jgi:hypothetical protein
MEFLLLWVDDLDDAIGALRHLLPTILAFIVALALFAATCLALVVAPHATLGILALMLSVSLFDAARRRRTRMLAERDRR